MSGPIDDPVPASGSGPVSDPVVALETQLATGDGSRLARFAARARTGAKLLVVLVAGTGVLALLVGVAAWRDQPVAMVVVALLCLPAILAPLYVARRTAALARAAAHPRDVAQQAKDLVSRVRDSAELRTLADQVVHRSPAEAAGPVSGGRIGGIRGAISLARLTSTVIGQAQPDDDRHPLLVPFTPERLGQTWSALWISLWGWLLAVLVLVVCVPALLVSLV